MTNPIVRSIGTKIGRADHHIIAFRTAREAFLQSSPYEVAIKEDTTTGKRIYYASKVNPFPPELPAIAADAIQNLRSALDHVAYQLVLASRGGSEPDWPVYFPIAASAKDYPGTKLGLLKGVSQDILGVMDAVEPYKSGRGHDLWLLNQINKIDKHKLLVGAASYFAGVDVSGDLTQVLERQPSFGDIKVPPLFIREEKSEPLEVNHELYIEPLNKLPVKDRKFAFDISFQAPGIVGCEPAINTIMRLRNLSIEVLNRFFPYLRQKS